MWIRKCDAELDCKCFDKTCSLQVKLIFSLCFFYQDVCVMGKKFNSGLKFLTQVDSLFPLSPSLIIHELGSLIFIGNIYCYIVQALSKMTCFIFQQAICTKRSCDIIFMKMKVIRFCLQKTISGSNLKQNNYQLFFQTRTISLK